MSHLISASWGTVCFNHILQPIILPKSSGWMGFKKEGKSMERLRYLQSDTNLKNCLYVYFSMLVSAIFFWESSTNIYYLPFGMITLMFVDITSVVGLRLNGEPSTPYESTKPRQISLLLTLEITHTLKTIMLWLIMWALRNT